jgi:polyvinyl alcohol dehydrogenase (cytochrome)
MLRRTAAAAALASVTMLALPGIVIAASLSSYQAYLGGPAHSSYAKTATAFTIANASGTNSIWKLTALGSFNASPIVDAGVVYIGSENGTFYALDATTGAVKWSKAFPIANCSSAGIVSTATVATDPMSGVLTVYVGAADHYLYALNATNGATIWRTLIGGTSSTYYNWSSPTIANGYVYYGVATACENAGDDGLVALNQHTGMQTGEYYTSGSASVAGASVYSSAAVAPDGSVFITTGDDNGASTNDSTSIVKLAEGTLTRLGGYQVPGLLGKNMDFNASPTLFKAGTTPMVGACDKNGVFYALAQANPTTPVWTRRLGIPPAPGSLAFCGGSAVYDGTHLFVGADARTSGAEPGSIYELNPKSGAVLWETPLSTGPVIGTPSLDGAGVLAVPTYNHASGATSAVYLINKANGTILRTINYRGPIFAQPVFADGELLIAGPTLQAYRP